MPAAILLWLMDWGGMFTGDWNIVKLKSFSDPLMLFQGGRALLPLLAVYICLMWIFLAKFKFPPFLSPLGLFFYYCLTGFAVSFLSPDALRSLYWSVLYFSPVLILWVAVSRGDSLDESLEYVKKIINLNYFAAILIFFALLFELFRSGKLGRAGLQFYNLPFGLGDMIANGVGRFALIIIIFCMVRLIFWRNISRYLLIFLLIPAVYLLMQTQSRTALLGLGVAGLLFSFIIGLKWQFLFISPAVAYVLWVTGYERRAHQSLDKLLNLTGRESTWTEAIDLIKQSPFLGWGFHSDRIMLDSQHIHNSYIHALLQSGILGLVLFLAALVSIWYVIWKKRLLFRIKEVEGMDKILLIESLLLLSFMTSRSFFESTAAFFGVDLLMLLPPIVYVFLWSEKMSEG